MSLLFDRYDSSAILRLLEEVGVLDALQAKGFSHFAVSIDSLAGLQHIRVRADKGGGSHLLLETHLRRVAIPFSLTNDGRPDVDCGLDLLLVHWAREQDPTAGFAKGRPRLLLQDHPGLGVLRRVFRIAVRIGAELGVDGIASAPKFFHDALIFHRSRLFLFLDGNEQGRYEALARDLDALALCDASLAVAGWCVHDQHDRVVHWQPGYQVFPISPRLTAHFNSAAYAAAVAAARARFAFRVDPASFSTARTQLAGQQALQQPCVRAEPTPR